MLTSRVTCMDEHFHCFSSSSAPINSLLAGSLDVASISGCEFGLIGPFSILRDILKLGSLGPQFQI